MTFSKALRVRGAHLFSFFLYLYQSIDSLDLITFIDLSRVTPCFELAKVVAGASGYYFYSSSLILSMRISFNSTCFDGPPLISLLLRALSRLNRNDAQGFPTPTPSSRFHCTATLGHVGWGKFILQCPA